MTKNALCIGINDYPGTQNDLSGCVNDAHDWKAALEKRGFGVEQLLDEAATLAGIRAGLGNLIEKARPGDLLVVTYSGHGTWVPDESGDEPDGRDEAWCPHDLMKNGPLLDDELSELASGKERGVRLVIRSDGRSQK
jgi:uncharacterized caspase-like protein